MTQETYVFYYNTGWINDNSEVFGLLAFYTALTGSLLMFWGEPTNPISKSQAVEE
jgi:hypothetical protein